MKIFPSPLEVWFRQYEEGSNHHLGSTMVSPFSLEELEEKFSISIPAATPLGYLPVHGKTSLRERIMDLFPQKKVSFQQVLVTQGAIEANFHALYSLIEPDCEVILQWPLYPQLHELPKMLGARVKKWEMTFDGGWKANLDHLEELISSDTRLLILNSPNNPTGYSFSREELDRIVSMADSAGAYILSDEVYQGIFPDNPPEPLAFRYPRAISTGSLSKAFSLPGLRLGWMITQDAGIIRKGLEIKEHLTICNAAISQSLAEAVLEKKEALLKENQQISTRNFRYFEGWKKEHKEFIEDRTLSRAVSAFPKLTGGQQSETLALRLLREKKTFLVPGTLWGYKDHFRVGFGHRQLKELEEALSILGEYLVNYKGK